MKKYIVVKEFRDAHEFKLTHKVEEDVTDFNTARKERLVKLGYVEVREIETPAEKEAKLAAEKKAKLAAEKEAKLAAEKEANPE